MARAFALAGAGIVCATASVEARADGPPLQIPWRCGEVRTCTQGHNGGSHTGNSSWAWDLGIAEGDEILAVSSGTVTHLKMDGDQGGCSSSFNSYANYVVVDNGDGTSVLYLHLQPDSTPLRVGDAVIPGQLVGRVGLTGWVCGAHLHMQVQETCGGAYCQSVPGEFADYGDPSAGQSIESTNCPACEVVLSAAAPAVVTERDPGCFHAQTNYWWSSFDGDEGHHFYTVATDLAEPVAIATWRFVVGEPGEYLVEVFVPDVDADSQGARYEVQHAAGLDVVAIDQSTQKGWQPLGVFELTGAAEELVRLGDDTGESGDLDRRLAVDSVRLTRVTDEGGSDGSDGDGDDGVGEGSSAGAETDDGGDGSEPLPGGSGDDDGSATSGEPPDDDAGSDGSRPALPEFDGSTDGGCGCRGGEPRPVGALALVVLAASRRRRRGELRRVRPS